MDVKHALITGSDGFIGRHMARRLHDDGWQVTGIDLRSGGNVFHMGSMTKRYDLVVHAAAEAPHRRAIDENLAAFPYNVALDAFMFNWAMRTAQRRFVYMSSCAIYPAWMQTDFVADTNGRVSFAERDAELIAEPYDVYGMTKLIGERMAEQARANGVNTYVVRPFSGYGEDQSSNFPMKAFAQRAQQKLNPFVIWGNADQIRDWIHVDDIINGILAIIAADHQDPVNICNGLGITMREVAGMLCTEMGYAPEIQVDPTAPLGAYYRVGNPDIFHSIYQPQVTITEGVRRMIAS